MNYTKVCITHNPTKETRVVALSEPLELYEHTEFWWTEGNFGCDCNRHLVFHNWSDGVDLDHKCSEGEYTVRWLELEDGTRVPIEDGEASLQKPSPGKVA